MRETELRRGVSRGNLASNDVLDAFSHVRTSRKDVREVAVLLRVIDDRLCTAEKTLRRASSLINAKKEAADGSAA